MGKLIEWQWRGYSDNHQSRTNLMIHLFAVPLFIGATVLLLWALFTGNWLLAAATPVLWALSMALQGRGHKEESHQPEPFTSAGNAMARIFLEQHYTFPKYVITGGWYRAFRKG